MDSFELNKFLGALLGTCLVLVAVHIASGAIFSPPVIAKPGYVIEVKQEQPAGGAAAAPAEVPIENLLASASGPDRRPGRQGMPDLPQPAARARATR